MYIFDYIKDEFEIRAVASDKIEYRKTYKVSDFEYEDEYLSLKSIIKSIVDTKFKVELDKDLTKLKLIITMSSGNLCSPSLYLENREGRTLSKIREDYEENRSK